MISFSRYIFLFELKAEFLSFSDQSRFTNLKSMPIYLLWNSRKIDKLQPPMFLKFHLNIQAVINCTFDSCIFFFIYLGKSEFNKLSSWSIRESWECHQDTFGCMYQKTKTIYKEFDPIMVKLNPILLPPSAFVASLWLWSFLFGGYSYSSN